MSSPLTKTKQKCVCFLYPTCLQVTGLAGFSVKHGLGVYGYSLMGAVGSITLGWIFMPVYMASGSLTTADYAAKRFGGKRVGVVVVTLVLVINVITNISMQLYATNIVVSQLYKSPQTRVDHIAMLLCSVLLVSAGGLFTVVYTGMWQFLFFATGIPIIFYYAYQPFDSWKDITSRYQRSWPKSTLELVRSNGTDSEFSLCGLPDKYSLAIIRPYDNPHLPWPGLLFGELIIAIYTYCINPSIVQFCLAGRNIVQVKYACLTNGFFECLTIFLIIPGFIARILFTDTVACSDPNRCEKLCGKRQGCFDLALTLILKELVPAGYRALALCAFLAASLTNIAANLHAGSTMFIFDIYRLFRPQVREFELTIVGKSVILIQASISLALAFEFQDKLQMHEFIRRMYACLAPPLVAVYLLGIFWSHVTEDVAFKSLVIGSSIAAVRVVWQSAYGVISCQEKASMSSTIPHIISNLHDLHFAIFLFVVCASLIVILGMSKEGIPIEYLYRLLFWLRHSRKRRHDVNRLKIRKLDSVEYKLGSQMFMPKRHSLPANMMANVDRRYYLDDEEIGTEESVDMELSMVEGMSNEETEEEEEGEEEEEKIREAYVHELKEDVETKRIGFCRNCGAMSDRYLNDYLMHSIMKMASIQEQPRQSSSLNMMLVLLLLVIVFIVGFLN